MGSGAAVCIVLNVVHRPLKHAGGEILRVMEVPRSVIHIVEDAIHVALVKHAKGFLVSLGGKREDLFVSEFRLRHWLNPTDGACKYNPVGFEKFHISITCPGRRGWYNQGLPNHLESSQPPGTGKLLLKQMCYNRQVSQRNL